MSVEAIASTERDEPFLAAYGLREHPFRLAPNTQFIYRTKATEEALRHGKSVIGGRLGLGAISGEIGLGKTTIARLFAQQEFADDAVAYLYRVPGGSRQTEAQILLEITHDLGIEERDRSTAEQSLKKIEEFARTQYQAGKTVAVIIDDAHQLRANGISTILALLGLVNQKHSLVQVMLFGQSPELSKVVTSDRALHSRLAHYPKLEPLDREELGQMLRHRAASAGSLERLFSDAAIERLYLYSNGVPRIACALANAALTIAYESSAELIEGEHVTIAGEQLEHDNDV